jgi:hypothetical protein
MANPSYQVKVNQFIYPGNSCVSCNLTLSFVPFTGLILEFGPDEDEDIEVLAIRTVHYNPKEERFIVFLEDIELETEEQSNNYANYFRSINFI